MEDQSWMAYFSDAPPPKPSLTRILTDVHKRELVSPIFVCLMCGKESSSQQAMASHCKKHVQAGMAKGTVQHIKCYPDHTKSHFLCIGLQPNPGGCGSANRIKKVPLPSYRTVFPYAGDAFISHLQSTVPAKPNGVGPIITPIGIRPNFDLTLRLGPTPSTTAADDSQGMRFSFPSSSSSANNITSVDDPKGKKVMPGPWN
ncbi:unnamed protein product [Urochloa decumbens]|uniref:C2H2-type domain-containing protein n=1 Tax=Urochloa decumbens TaxID=240449 RepID=A0ABC9DGR0_9POAL